MRHRLLKGCLIISILLTCLISKLSYANLNIPSPSEIKSFLQQQTTIQIFADNVGGFGNLAAADNIVLRLSQLGFSGTSEIIYRRSSKQALSQLFNLPPDFADDYTIKMRDSDIRFIESEYENAHRDLSKKIDVAFLTNNGAVPCAAIGSVCNFNFLAYVFNWVNQSDLSNSDISVIQISAKTVYSFLPSSSLPKSLIISNIFFDSVVKNYLLVSSDSLFASTEDYLSTVAGQEIIKKNVALPVFINKMKDQSIFVLPTYGYPVQNVNNMLQIIAGARYAQLNSAALKAKPLIIAVYYDFEKTSTEIDQIFHQGHLSDMPSNIIEELALNKPGIVKFANISDPNTVNIINELQPNTILVLSMALNTGMSVKNIPKFIFDGLYTYQGENILPPIHEGMSSLSQLLLTGKPFFTCADWPQSPLDHSPRWKVGYGSISDPGLQKELIDFYGERDANYKDQMTGFCSNEYSWIHDAMKGNGAIYKTFGNFIIQSLSHDSALSRYFQDLKIKLSDYQYDRVYMSLAVMLNIKNGDTAGLEILKAE